MIGAVEVETVTGERTTLRPWRAGDAAWYVEARDDTVLAFTTERADLTADDVVAAIEAADASDSVAAFAIEDDQRRLVGNLAVEIDGDVAEVSYFLAPAGRGRGLMTDALRSVTGWLRSRDVGTVRAVTARGNDASAAALVRAGFRAAGETEHPRLGPSTRWELTLRAGRPSAP